MKRYEKLTAEQVVDLFDRCRLAQFYGHECPLGKFKSGETHACEDDCLIEWLRSESEMVPRWQTIRSQEDLERTREDFWRACDLVSCKDCKRRIAGQSSVDCYFAYLSELVEKPEGGMD